MELLTHAYGASQYDKLGAKQMKNNACHTHFWLVARNITYKIECNSKITSSEFTPTTGSSCAAYADHVARLTE